MEHEGSHDLENEQQFWNELEETVSKDCGSYTLIDDALRSYLSLITFSWGRFLHSDQDLGRCSYKLQSSPLFAHHADYIRRQLVQCLLEDDEPDVILIATSFLLVDARNHERTYELLNEVGAFPRLVELISSPKQHGNEGVHRLLMELIYEMSRIQRISPTDLASIRDDFVCMLFDMIEQVSDDVNDPYHYPTIRVLLVLNEQFMVAAHDPGHGQAGIPLTNKVIKMLSAHGSRYKTFGENIILLLNREDETSLQLLTLKLLYLLFTTPPTYEYFYTNDLHVLVDILVRNLLDLPEEASALRHTYLRVLYPLLEHTQLQYPPHYKREEIRKLLTVLGGGQISDPSDEHDSLGLWSHFDDVDETTKRLVRRCQGVSWLTDPETEARVQAESPTETEASTPSSSTSPLKSHPPALPAPRKLKKRNSSKASTLTIDQYLAPQFELARKSSHSMMEVAAQMEKPGVITPSRNPSLKHNLRAASAAIMNKKEKPPPPKARRSGWTRPKGPRLATDVEIAKAGIVEIEAKFNTDSRSKELSDEERSSERASESNVGHAHVHSLRSPFKKPPPAPKARRWRGKRAKEEGDGAGGADREPGKFNSQLSSVVTTIDDKAVEVSPFSPVETTFVPPENGIVERQPKSSVREALAEAHGQALADITETLEHAHLTVPEQAESAVELEREEEPGLADQDHLHDNLLRQQLPHTITPEARVILTPPGQAPPRAVPGPRWELERSPFLTDEEDPESEGGPDVDADAHVGLHAEAESPHGGTKIEETVGAS